MQDLIFWILAAVSLLSLIFAIVFAFTYRRSPKENKIDSELLNISDVVISNSFTDNDEDLSNMELTVTPSVIPPINPTDVVDKEVYAANIETKPLPVKKKKQSDMDVINGLLEKLK